MAKRGAGGGEFALIEALRRRVGEPGPPWQIGIGDDAAVLRPRAGHDLVWTVDALVEDVHFRWRTSDPAALGAKCLAASLSDLAAMGATPLGCLLTLALPSDRDERLAAFWRGLLGASRRCACPLVGGDTVRGPVWTLSLTALGQVPRGKALCRSGARPGDRILVTGSLGASALGLALLERGAERAPGAARFARRHRRPDPPWQAGDRLLRTGHATAAIDVSDGLGQDLGHVLDESGVGAELDLERLPLAPGARALCERHGLDPVALAFGGGEDFELLFCVRERAPAASVFQKRLRCPVREVGRIVRGRGLRVLLGDRRVEPPSAGYEHFKSPPPQADKD